MKKNHFVTIRSLLLLVWLAFISSCNLFKYGIEERKREAAAKQGNLPDIKNKEERLKKAESILKTARLYEGTPYLLGGDSKKGIDCSGLVMISFKNAGVVLPRTSIEQSKIGTLMDLKEALPGDLIFFKFKKANNKNPVNHVGIVSRLDYSGKLYFVHASSSLGVIESSLDEKYYREVFVKVMRVY